MTSDISLDKEFEANDYLESSISFAMSGKIDMAINVVKKAIEIYPEFAQAHNKLGDYYIKKGMAHEALEAYQTSLKYNDRNENSHFDCGCTLAALGRYEEGLDELNIALSMKPEHYETYAHIASINLKLGLYEEAKRNALKALVNDPTCILATFTLACAYRELGYLNESNDKFQDVIAHYKQMIARRSNFSDKGFAEGNYYVGICYLIMGTYDEALKYLLKANEYDTEDVDYHFSSGMMYSDGDAFCALAEAYIGVGNRQEATTAIDNALKFDPENQHYISVKKSL